jgi:Asp/Glu/hydantoin racemase
MPTVVAIYTGQGLMERIQPIFKQELPDCRLVNIMDDSLIADVIRAGQVTPAITRRLMLYYRNAEEIGADFILNTCSSVGEVVDLAALLIDKPIVKIDQAMAYEAVSQYATIGVIATLPTTLEPTKRLLYKEAGKLGKSINVIDGLAMGAYQALVAGKPEEHDRLIVEAVIKVAEKSDVIVLAQGSMMRMEQTLREITGKPVFSSPHLGVLSVKRLIEAKG